MSDRAETVGVVGLGMMGSGIAQSLLDVGIAGGPEAAASGSLLTTVGGSSDAYDRAAEALRALSVRTIYAGESGAGMSLKLLKNALSFATMSAVHECLLLGEKLGISGEQMKTIASESNLVDHFFWFPMSRPSALPLVASAREAVQAAEHFAGIARKDLSAAILLAEREGVDHQVLDLARDRANAYFLLPEELKD